MPITILGWEGVCYIPGDKEPDEQGRECETDDEMKSFH